ncbi:C-type lectin domain family 2 member B-like [Emydura macquarii macquarii]|uniref:C-type lectin domain family 2 member B-like n=1 Tax=Emydura macquarii macquarii TaxID=1129001 RepID=UPI00352A6B4E
MDSEQPLNGRQGSLSNLRLWKAAGWKAPLIIGIVVVAIVVAVAVTVAVIFLHMKSPPESQMPNASANAKLPAACCPDDWVGYRGKCYYFSETEGTWDSSQSFCSSINASLARIDTQKDLVFIMQYKDVSEYWIGLKRTSAQPWKWVNSEQFNNLFMVRGEGDCAYLSDGFATSSWCSTKRYWICSKPDGMQREDAMTGG